MSLKDGEIEPIVRDCIQYTYTRFDDNNEQGSNEYWTATQGYWAAVLGE